MAETLFPKLIVTGADEAIAFYTDALGATLTARHTDGSDRVVHAELDIAGRIVALAEAVPDWGWHAPADAGDPPVLLSLTTDDPDGVAERMTDRGATVVIPVEDRPYGKREGRLRDPHGHLWIVSADLP